MSAAPPAPAVAPVAAPAAAPANGSSNGASSNNTTAAPGVTPPTTDVKAPAQQTAVEKLIKKLKVAGREEEVDMASPEALRELQIARHNASKQRAFNEQYGQFSQMLERLKSGDASVLTEAGVDIEGLVKRAHEEAAQRAALSPEQQEVAQLKAELARRESETQRQQESIRQQAESAKRQAYKKSTFESLMSAAKAAGLSLDSKAQRGSALSLAAKLNIEELRAGRPPLTPELLGLKMEQRSFSDLAEKLKAVVSRPELRVRRAAELKALNEAVFSGLEGDALLDTLGEQLLARVYQAGVDRLYRKNQPGGGQASTNGAATTTAAQPGNLTDMSAIRNKWGFGG